MPVHDVVVEGDICGARRGVRASRAAQARLPPLRYRARAIIPSLHVFNVLIHHIGVRYASAALRLGDVMGNTSGPAYATQLEDEMSAPASPLPGPAAPAPDRRRPSKHTRVCAAARHARFCRGQRVAQIFPGAPNWSHGLLLSCRSWLRLAFQYLGTTDILSALVAQSGSATEHAPRARTGDRCSPLDTYALCPL